MRKYEIFTEVKTEQWHSKERDLSHPQSEMEKIQILIHWFANLTNRKSGCEMKFASNEC